MARRLPLRPREALALLGLACALAISPVPAASPHAELEADQMTVHELMRIESDQALRAARETMADAAGSLSLPDAMQADADTRLLAIYGTGRRLAAQVLVRGKPVLYMQGLPRPVGAEKDDQAFLLRGITRTCIRLEHAGQFRTLCIHPELSGRQ